MIKLVATRTIDGKEIGLYNDDWGNGRGDYWFTANVKKMKQMKMHCPRIWITDKEAKAFELSAKTENEFNAAMLGAGVMIDNAVTVPASMIA